MCSTQRRHKGTLRRKVRSSQGTFSTKVHLFLMIIWFWVSGWLEVVPAPCFPLGSGPWMRKTNIRVMMAIITFGCACCYTTRSPLRLKCNSSPMVVESSNSGWIPIKRKMCSMAWTRRAWWSRASRTSTWPRSFAKWSSATRTWRWSFRSLWCRRKRHLVALHWGTQFSMHNS